MLSQVKLNDFQRQWAVTKSSVHSAVDRVGSSGWWILGNEVVAFENALSKVLNVRHAIGVGNGMDALEICLRLPNLPAGSKILTTPLSAFATSLAIIRAGHVPVFCDVDERGLLDLNQACDLLKRDRAIRGLVPVHLYGHPLDLTQLKHIQTTFDVHVVEDVAQALGATFDSVPVGTACPASATSFYPTKNLGVMGDGGAVLANSAEAADAAKRLRDYGQSAKYTHDVLGLNSRLDELQAAILLDAHLPHFQQWTQTRQRIAARYLAAIDNPAIKVPLPPPNGESVFHLFAVLVRDPNHRGAFMNHLRDNGVQSASHYPSLIPEQKAIEHPDVRGGLTNARMFANSEVSLPIHPFLRDDEVSQVISAVNSWRPQ